MKLACVVQRYGPSIAGGSEAHCRHFAERLAATHDVTVLTTCASDYVTWANTFPPGESHVQGVRVIRFEVARQRRMFRFAELSDHVFAGDIVPAEMEEEWFRENGPDVPGLLDHLRLHGSEYDIVLFWTFRYAPSFFGLPIVADRAILLPTAEEDPAIHLGVLHDYFRKPAGYLFLTPEEASLVSARAGGLNAPSAIIGTGLEPPATPPGRAVLAAAGVPEAYVLYMGRVDRNKGCGTLLEYFQEYLDAGGHTSLVLAGPSKMAIPSHPAIKALGYVSDGMREALLAHARALVVPSPYESLSMVLLEAWNHGVPALVNASCKVLQGQVRRADGGLYYASGREFVAMLDYLLRDDAARRALGTQGRAYVDREYRWPIVIARTQALLEAVAAARRPAAG